MGSADVRPRNLDHRVEVVYPLEKPAHVHYMKTQVLDFYLKDTLRARLMQPDGTYLRAKPNDKPLDVQDWLMGHRVDKKA